MNPSQDTIGGEEPFVPFTKAERMQQLADIDKVCIARPIAFLPLFIRGSNH